MMKHPFLEVTYRRGKPVAGYLYLSEPSSGTPCQTRHVRPDVLVDIDSNGRALGVEFLAPGFVTPEDVEAIVRCLDGVPVPTEDLSPIMA
jgi:uncharacterized protein YuzE